jgi:hypothetical protein
MWKRSERNGLGVALLLAALGCGRASSPRTSSSSNWLNCEQDADCGAVASGAYCGEQGYCVDASGTPLASDGSGSEVAASSQTPLPSEGRVLPELSLSSANQMLVDETGVVWLSACEGLFAVKGSEIHRYTWIDSPLPQGPLQLSVDGSNRVWAFSPHEPLVVIEDGAFRTVYDLGSPLFSVSRDGTAWVTGSEPFEEFSRVWTRQVYPTLGPRIDVPDPGVNAIAAGGGGSLWVATGTGLYRWSGSAWAGPLAPDVNLIHYDARQDVLYSDSERLRWNGTSLEREPLLLDASPASSEQIGFDARGRLITVSDSAVRWIEAGQVAESQPLSLTQAPIGAIGPDGSLYLASSDSVSRLVGAAMRQLARIRPFDPEVEFPWRAQPFGLTLADPSREATRQDLANPTPQIIGVKVHVQGAIYADYESTGVVVGGQVLPSTSAKAADEVSTFLEERGEPPFFKWPESREAVADPANATIWDLYGYLEAGSCFDWAATRQFWVVEGYPMDMSTNERTSLAADLRARYPEPQ